MPITATNSSHYQQTSYEETGLPILSYPLLVNHVNAAVI